MSKTKDADIKNLSFEEALSELESIVNGLENGQIGLEGAISSYIRGAALKDHCDRKLKDAKLKVEKIAENQEKSA